MAEVQEIEPKHVLYCSVCSLPPEYCEYGPTIAACLQWLKSAHPDVYTKLHSEHGDENDDQVSKLASNVASLSTTLSTKSKEKVTRDIEKNQAKHQAKAQRDLAKKLATHITIKRIERNKRKHVIAIQGLPEVFDPATTSSSSSSTKNLSSLASNFTNGDLKRIAKSFANKFATGASVTKSPDGRDEIVIQGDVGDEVQSLLQGVLGEFNLDKIQIDRTDDGKKKPAAK